MLNKTITLALAATALLATSTVGYSAEGHTFWNARGKQATIVEETFWERNGYAGFDALIYEEFYDGRTEFVNYGVVCFDDFHRDVGPAVRRMSFDDSYIVWSEGVVPYANNRLSGQAGYAQDIWHNVCADDDIY